MVSSNFTFPASPFRKLIKFNQINQGGITTFQLCHLHDQACAGRDHKLANAHAPHLMGAMQFTNRQLKSPKYQSDNRKWLIINLIYLKRKKLNKCNCPPPSVAISRRKIERHNWRAQKVKSCTAVPRNSGHFCSTSRFSYSVETAGLRVACQPSIYFYFCKANQPVPSRPGHYSEVQLYFNQSWRDWPPSFKVEKL